LQELGLFCVVWSQIDMLITMLLTNLSGAPSVDVIAMTASATTAPRLAMVERIVGRIRKDEATAMYGFWGHFHPPRGGETVGSHYDRYRDNPIMVGTLSSLTDKGARLGSQLHHAQLQLEQIRQGLSP
jgi:hypothetical protein